MSPQHEQFPEREKLSFSDRARCIGQHIIDALALAGQVYVCMPIDPTETQGYTSRGLKEIQDFIDNPENH